METGPVSWEPPERTNRELAERDCSESDLERFILNVGNANLVAPSRELHELPGEPEPTSREVEPKPPGSFALQDQWNNWVDKREQMGTEIKRGRECLEQVKKELATLRARLDEWTGYEVVCGRNPLSDYMQAIATKERIEQYLPVWLQQREDQLRALNVQMERCARQNGIEHWL
jgi:hypothetical protein